MANEKKLTKREKFERLLAKPEVQADKVSVEFIEHELELLAKKNSSEKKPTATQLANETLKDEILEHMEAEPNRLFTISEMLKVFPCCADLTLPKVSAMVRQLKEDGKVERVEEKRKAYFRLAQ
jgi:hypothetical protein